MCFSGYGQSCLGVSLLFCCFIVLISLYEPVLVCFCACLIVCLVVYVLPTEFVSTLSDASDPARRCK